MEDYKEKYEQALERAKVINPGTADYEVAVKIFPELKESKDERIRKELVRAFTVTADKRELEIYGNGITYGQVLAWLEKQGEQKPISAEAVSVDEACNHHKFKVGDWITKDGATWQVLIANNNYILLSQDGLSIKEKTSIIDSEFHLWTIQDAKDGDVLYSLDSKQPFLYKERTQFSQAKGYCCINKFGEFAVWNTNKCVIYTDKYIPATKEQRDLLFQKMKEAGYEWDAENKELKKIEQKPNFCHHEVDFSNCSEEYRKAYYDGWNNCNQQHAQLKAEQKPAEWSDYDECMLTNLIEDTRFGIDIEYIDWLKSLRPQSKQKLSKEDEKVLNLIIQDYEVASKSFCGHQGKLNWLKLLKDRLSFHD